MRDACSTRASARVRIETGGQVWNSWRGHSSTRASARVRIETAHGPACHSVLYGSTRASARVRIETKKLGCSRATLGQHPRLGAGED